MLDHIEHWKNSCVMWFFGIGFMEGFWTFCGTLIQSHGMAVVKNTDERCGQTLFFFQVVPLCHFNIFNYIDGSLNVKSFCVSLYT